MSAELSLTQQAGASAPAVSVPVAQPRLGEELALALAAPDAAVMVVPEDQIVLDAERLEVYHLA